VSHTAAKVVEMSRKDSTLSRLAHFGNVYLTRHGQFFFPSEVGLFIQSHPKSHFNSKVDFKTVLVQVKSVSPNKVTPRSACVEWDVKPSSLTHSRY